MMNNNDDDDDDDDDNWTVFVSFQFVSKYKLWC